MGRTSFGGKIRRKAATCREMPETNKSLFAAGLMEYNHHHHQVARSESRFYDTFITRTNNLLPVAMPSGDQG